MYALNWYIDDQFWIQWITVLGDNTLALPSLRHAVDRVLRRYPRLASQLMT